MHAFLLSEKSNKGKKFINKAKMDRIGFFGRKHTPTSVQALQASGVSQEVNQTLFQPSS